MNGSGWNKFNRIAKIANYGLIEDLKKKKKIKLKTVLNVIENLKNILFDLSDPLEVVPNMLRNSMKTNLIRRCS